jgi:hypothetical protein
MSEELPYRYVAREGMYTGTTFVYYPHDRIITYRTEDPQSSITQPRVRTRRRGLLAACG